MQDDKALFAAAPAITSDVVVFVERIGRVWRAVKNDDNWKSECVRYISARMTKAGDIAASDLHGGFERMLQASPPGRVDGRLVEPPGPHEQWGFVLMARAARREAGPRKEMPTGPRRLHGMPCPKCMGPRDFLPAEGFIYCQPCNTVTQHRPGEALEFADPPPLTDEEVQYHKDKVLRMAGRMAERSAALMEDDDGEA